MLYLIIGIVIVVVLGLAFVNIKNRLVKEELQIKTAFSNAQLVVDRRFKNIQSTVNLMKEHNSELNDTLTKVTQMRTGNTPESYAKADSAMKQVVKQIEITVEKYPEIGDLFDSSAFMQLMAKHDRDVEMSKKLYNHEVEEFNTLILSIPYSFFAKGLKSYDLWEVQEALAKDETIIDFK